MDIFKALFHAFGLPMAAGRQQGFVLAMDPAEDISLRFAMADQIKFRHKLPHRIVVYRVRFFFIRSAAAAACSR